MHELSLVAGMFETLMDKAREHKARKITGVHLRVGAMSGVVPELLHSAFEIYKKGTLAEEAVLSIVDCPLRVRCGQCGRTTDVREWASACPSCGASGVEVVSGDELFLDKIDLEIE